MAIQGDMLKVFSEDKIKLEKLLKEVKLDAQTKELVLLALEFGYTAANASRYSLHTAKEYTDAYDAMIDLINKTSPESQ